MCIFKVYAHSFLIGKAGIKIAQGEMEAHVRRPAGPWRAVCEAQMLTRTLASLPTAQARCSPAVSMPCKWEIPRLPKEGGFLLAGKEGAAHTVFWVISVLIYYLLLVCEGSWRRFPKHMHSGILNAQEAARPFLPPLSPRAFPAAPRLSSHRRWLRSVLLHHFLT